MKEKEVKNEKRKKKSGTVEQWKSGIVIASTPSKLDNYIKSV
jgi:hypothetical protein